MILGILSSSAKYVPDIVKKSVTMNSILNSKIFSFKFYFHPIKCLSSTFPGITNSWVKSSFVKTIFRPASSTCFCKFV